jgi:hypothetical protein
MAAGQQVDGPALIVEPGSTLVLEPGWRVELTPRGDLLLSAGAIANPAGPTRPNPTRPGSPCSTGAS